MRDRTYRCVIVVFRLVFRALGLRITVTGAEHLPTAGPAVIASNHLSYLDFTFVELAATGRRRLIRFMAKQAVFANPVSGPLMRAMGHIPVDREHGAAAYRKATRAVRAGELVGVFPEATISRAWVLKDFKLGAATLAVKEKVPLVPVVVWGSQRILTVDGHVGLRRGKAITVAVGVPLLAGPGETARDLDGRVRDAMQALLHAAQRDYPDRPSSDADRWWLPAYLGGSAPEPAAAIALDAAKIRPD